MIELYGLLIAGFVLMGGFVLVFKFMGVKDEPVKTNLFWKTMALLFVIRLLDISTTMMFVSKGGVHSEANPIMVFLLSMFGPVGFAIGFFLAVIGTFVGGLILKKSNIAFFSVYATTYLCGLFVISWNFYRGYLGWF